MRLLSADTGDTLVSLSKRKLREAGKAGDASAQTDPQVSTEFALIQLVGYAAEVHLYRNAAGGSEGAAPDRSMSANDYNAARGAVGTENIPVIENAAREIVEIHWAAIDVLARRLLRDRSLDAVDALDILDAMYGAP